MPLSFWKKKVTINSAKSFVGCYVNLRLADGSVLVNVKLEEITTGRRLKCKADGRRAEFVVLSEVVEIRSRPLLFMQEVS